jgi:hypothetical protein
VSKYREWANTFFWDLLNLLRSKGVSVYMWVSHFLNFKHSTASLSSLGRTFECSQKQMPGGEGCSEFWNRAMHRVGEAAARLQSLCIQLHQKCLGNRSFWNLYYLFKIQAFSFPPLFSPGLFVFCHSFSNMCVSVCVCVCVCTCAVFFCFPLSSPAELSPTVELSSTVILLIALI